MKTPVGVFTLGCAGAIAFAGDEPKPTDANPACTSAVTNTPPRQGNRGPENPARQRCHWSGLSFSRRNGVISSLQSMRHLPQT